MNAGGPHCLKYDVATSNLLGVTLVVFDGTVVEIGGKHRDNPGYDLLGLICGSEGRLASSLKPRCGSCMLPRERVPRCWVSAPCRVVEAADEVWGC